LANASGGIIGYELGESLTQLITIYGAVALLILLLGVLFTLAFGIQWNKTWSTLKATPAYLQELFYRNVPESESAFDLTTPPKNKNRATTKPEPVTAQAEFVEPADHVHNKEHVVIKPSKHSQTAERLFDDMVEQERTQQHSQFDQDDIDDIDDLELERTLEKAHRLEQESKRTVSSGEVWKALQQDQDHNRDIDALLKASEDDSANHFENRADLKQHHAFNEPEHVARDAFEANQAHQQKSVNWDDDQVFDELLAVVPNGQTATDVHSPFNNETVQSQQNANQQFGHHTEQNLTDFHHGVATASAASVAVGQNLASELDDLAMLESDDYNNKNNSDYVQQHAGVESDHQTATARTTTNYSQSTAFTRAEIQTNLQPSSLVSEEEKSLIASDKDAFRDAWLETAGKPQEDSASQLEDEFDLDAPLTDSHGRPMSRAMQVAQKRRDLPTLPGLDLLDRVDPNKKVNFTAEQLSRLSELLEIKLQEFNVKAKVIEAQPGPVVTRFELDLAPGVKASKVTNISRDL
ncbi:MAG: DNA translocase FtsK, partial [Acinetobacter sp.]